MGEPTWMYKKVLGPGGREKMKAEIFDSDKLPEGWADSPAKTAPAKKAGRPPKKEQVND